MTRLNCAEEYAQQQIQGAGKLKSLQMLHEGGVRFLKHALADTENRAENIIKTQNIIAQLQMTLKPEKGELAELIFYLYDYIYVQLEKGDEASINNSVMLFNHLIHTFRLMKVR